MRMKMKRQNSKKSPQKRSAGGAELRDSFICCGGFGARDRLPAEWWPKVIFGLILAITYTSQIKLILANLELL